MKKNHMAIMIFLGLLVAALFASLSDTDRERLINTAKAQVSQLKPAITQPNQTKEKMTAVAETAVEVCTMASKIAETIMRSRQSGVPMSEMVSLVPSDSLSMALIIDAYQYPRLSIKSNQDDYVRDFADEAMVDCMNDLG